MSRLIRKAKKKMYTHDEMLADLAAGGAGKSPSKKGGIVGEDGVIDLTKDDPDNEVIDLTRDEETGEVIKVTADMLQYQLMEAQAMLVKATQ